MNTPTPDREAGHGWLPNLEEWSPEERVLFARVWARHGESYKPKTAADARAFGVLLRHLGELLDQLDRARAERDQYAHELTGASLALWEEERDHARTRVAARSARKRAARLRAERDVLTQARTELVKLHDWDELIFGGFYCMHCTPDDPDSLDDPIAWPCPSLRAVGMTDDEAVGIIRARRSAVEAAAKGGEPR